VKRTLELNDFKSIRFGASLAFAEADPSRDGWRHTIAVNNDSATSDRGRTSRRINGD